ncbi:hypothetical protein M885DRAFT_510924 [Pelagophyceae sp. CCMP2097]|nr:hypothetical protein M885DRAFT_510924 [Pelagophyceae sp. CCMP2097]
MDKFPGVVWCRSSHDLTMRGSPKAQKVVEFRARHRGGPALAGAAAGGVDGRLCDFFVIIAKVFLVLVHRFSVQLRQLVADGENSDAEEGCEEEEPRHRQVWNLTPADAEPHTRQDNEDDQASRTRTVQDDRRRAKIFPLVLLHPLVVQLTVLLALRAPAHGAERSRRRRRRSTGTLTRKLRVGLGD